MKGKPLLQLSFILSLVSIAITVLINHKIAEAYNETDGKGKLLFGIIERLRFGYQYWACVISISAFLLAALSKSQGSKIKLGAIALSLFAITIIFLRIWRILL
jgi:hypothetical protein